MLRYSRKIIVGKLTLEEHLLQFDLRQFEAGARLIPDTYFAASRSR